MPAQWSISCWTICASKPENDFLRGVADGTQRVLDAFRMKGVKTVFESNPGNHFKEPDLRMAKAICWAVSNCGKDGPSKLGECELRCE